ncbi:hypothetical protein [Streptomyces californicus]|uniref:hypothetical protein n=1 Tax=Streptomyces californicus TaxID=67351 RepID=UPI00296E82A8|nr:hypothetical protein [Streptomyces californicus]MDW4917718.1 hypothetical protein [Streptomyces californicus]
MDTDPLIHPHQPLITPAGEEVSIDIRMVPVIERLWKIGLRTTACCQDVGEATRAVRDSQRSAPSTFDGAGFIAYHDGYALLKMPREDAQTLADLLGRMPTLSAAISDRWGPEGWRMNVPLLHNDGVTQLGADAWVHFPKDQIPALTEALDTVLFEASTR